MQRHLAILAPGWIEPILDGTKTIESRFTKVRCAPYGKVHAGDLVYMKESGGPVKGNETQPFIEQCQVASVSVLTFEFCSRKSFTNSISCFSNNSNK